MKKPAVLALILAAIVTGCQAPDKPATGGFQVMAYFYPRSDDFDPDTLQLDRLTHIIFSFTEVIDNEMKLRDEARGLLLRKLAEQKEKYPGLKVMIACGGWGGSGGFSEMARTKKSRRVFVQSAVRFIEDYTLDGLDIDWEYPGQPGAGNPYIPEDRENFTALMRELRKAMDRTGREQTLTFAAGASQNFFSHIELGKVMKQVDYVNMMTYDFAGGGDRYTSHHTNLGTVTGKDIEGTPAAETLMERRDSTWPSSATEIIEFCVDMGVQPSQIVIGAAFYGKGWRGVPPENNGLYQPVREAWTGNGRYYALQSNYIDKNGFTRYWDETAEAPYLYNPADSIFITYEDTVSARLKTEYAIRNQLGGIMFWELGGDVSDRGLLAAIHAATEKQ
ncbi:MAG: glycoside hydrolase family 18 protein [Bacteroidales bacterium]|nr:glycoside hydrolase family 18 protein [Bacteroidales bacterium]MDT8372964.1 glycoside hydrolase family 18 protein [Bacteroidales bacterium]